MKVAIEGKWTDEDMTPWFDPHIKPAKRGVYEVESVAQIGQTFWAKWDGEYWSAVKTHHAAARVERIKSHEQNRKWRGLCKKP